MAGTARKGAANHHRPPTEHTFSAIATKLETRKENKK